MTNQLLPVDAHCGIGTLGKVWMNWGRLRGKEGCRAAGERAPQDGKAWTLEAKVPLSLSARPYDCSLEKPN